MKQGKDKKDKNQFLNRKKAAPSSDDEEKNPEGSERLNDKYKESLENFQTFYDSIHRTDTITQVKFKDVIYSVGDHVLVYGDNDEELVATLLKIIPRNGVEYLSEWPSIEVQWYYKRDDINQRKNNIRTKLEKRSLSEYEVFQTEHKDVIFIENLIGKCEVYSFEEFLKIDELDGRTFFTRANYDVITQLLEPKFSKWKKVCICHTPENPDELYLICDLCNKYFHPECVGIKEEESEKIEKFYCPKCKKTNIKK